MALSWHHHRAKEARRTVPGRRALHDPAGPRAAAAPREAAGFIGPQGPGGRTLPKDLPGPVGEGGQPVGLGAPRRANAHTVSATYSTSASVRCGCTGRARIRLLARSACGQCSSGPANGANADCRGSGSG